MYSEGLFITLAGSALILTQQYRTDLIEPHDLHDRHSGKLSTTNKQKGTRSASATTFKLLRNRYVIGFAIMSLADWLQGPFLLPMYASFGLKNRDVAVLYAVDYCVGIVAGLVAGGLADTLGAKKACVIYGYLYAASCLCNHFADIYMPIVGLGCAIDGLCNALLRTSFESWIAVICQRNNYKDQWAAHASAVANWFSTLMSLLSGIFCHFIVAAVTSWARKTNEQADIPSFAFVATMDAAAILLVIGAVYISRNWEDDHLHADHSKQAKGGEGGEEIIGSLRKAVENLTVGAQALLSTVNKSDAVEPKHRRRKGSRISSRDSHAHATSLKAIIFLEVAFEATLMIFIGVFPMSVSVVDKERGAAMMGVLFVSLMGGILFGNSLANFAVNTGVAPTLGWRGMSAVATVSCALLSCVTFIAESEDERLIETFGGKDLSSNVLFVGLCMLEVCFGFYYPFLTVMHTAYAADGFRNSCVAIVRSISYAIALCALLALWLTNAVWVCWLAMTLSTLVATWCAFRII